jgi:hypothetical protein
MSWENGGSYCGLKSNIVRFYQQPMQQGASEGGGGSM